MSYIVVCGSAHNAGMVNGSIARALIECYWASGSTSRTIVFTTNVVYIPNILFVHVQFGRFTPTGPHYYPLYVFGHVPTLLHLCTATRASPSLGITSRVLSTYFGT